jgi:O-antigen/teichoic acid export membrane protein
MFTIKLSAFMKNIVITTITSLLTTISMIFIIRFLAKGLGPEEFGAYSLARRIISTIAPLVILSMDVALSRYIAMTYERKLRSSYIVSSIISTGIAITLLLAVAISSSKHLSHLIFHSNQYLKLYYACLFLVGGYTIFIITYASLLGMQKIKKANLLQLCLMAIIPLTISYVFASTKSSSFIMFLMGLAFYLSFFPLILIIKKTGMPQLNDVRSSLKVLLKYCLPRAPAGFFLAGLFTLGPLLASHFEGLKEAGFFVVGQSVFRIMEAAIVAFGLVALPKISQLLAEGKEDFLKKKIEDILIMIFQLGLFITIHTFIWSREIILIWLGSEYQEVVSIMKIIILSLGPYLAYVLLRSIVDAVEVRAINTMNLALSLIFAAVISIFFVYVGFGIIGLATGTTIGFSILGVMTSLYLMRRYLISFKNFMFRWVLLLNILFAGTIIVIKNYIISSFIQYELLIIGFIIESILFLCYLYFFYKKDSRWLLELKKRIFAQT